jgi:hypothetical protein
VGVPTVWSEIDEQALVGAEQAVQPLLSAQGQVGWRGPFLRFLLLFSNVLVYVLLAAAFVKLMTNLWLDASIILGVVLINALASRITHSLMKKIQVHTVGSGQEM